MEKLKRIDDENVIINNIMNRVLVDITMQLSRVFTSQSTLIAMMMEKMAEQAMLMMDDPEVQDAIKKHILKALEGSGEDEG